MLKQIEVLGEVVETWLLRPEPHSEHAVLLPTEFAAHLMARSLSEKFQLRHQLRVGIQPLITSSVDETAGIIMLTAACRAMAVSSWQVTMFDPDYAVATLVMPLRRAYERIYHAEPSQQTVAAFREAARRARLPVYNDQDAELVKTTVWLGHMVLATGEQRAELRFEDSLTAALGTVNEIANQLAHARGMEQRQVYICAMERHVEQWLRRLGLDAEARGATMPILQDGLKLLFGSHASS